MRLASVAAILVLSLAGTAARAHPRPVDPAELRTAIARGVRSGRIPGSRWPDFSDVAAAVRSLYGRSGGDPLWSELAGPTPAARALIGELEHAGDQGLSPADYDADALRRAAQSLLAAEAAPRPEELARFDIALTVHALRFASALHHGRVSPRVVHATLDLPREAFDAAAVVDSLRHTQRLERVLEAIQPPFRHYRLLHEALVRFRRLERDSGLVPLPRPRAPLRVGDAYAGAVPLRRLLIATGDLTEASAAPPVEALYDSMLAAAVRRFQLRHGLTPGGTIDVLTERTLDASLGERIRQMELTLERWRWMPRSFGAPPVLVNIPAFRLYAFRTLRDEESQLLAMNVQVGKAFDHRTPVFAAAMRYIVFRPYWEVTPTIGRREIRPKAWRDAGYLAREHLELIEDGGGPLPATPANIERIGAGVRVRQRPGPGNALGDVKFIFPNPHNVYLHDTPAKSLFDRPRRDFSHGCIRLSHPLELAELLLRDQQGWNMERIRAAVAADHPTQVDLVRPVPVYILYATAMARENGTVLFYPDLYKHDLELDRILQHGYPYPS